MAEKTEQGGYKTIEEWCRDWGHRDGEPWLVECLRKDGFNETQILAFLSTYSNVCHHCRDSHTPCACTWDD